MATFYSSPGGFTTSSPTTAPASAAPAPAPAPAAVAVASRSGGYYYGAAMREYDLTAEALAEHYGISREHFPLVSEEARRDFFLHTQPDYVRFFIHPQTERVEVPVPIFVQVPVLQQQGMSGLEAVLTLAAALGVIVLVAAIAEELFR